MFFEAARQGKNEPLMYVLTIIVVFIGWQVVGALPLLIGAYLALSSQEEMTSGFEEFTATQDFGALGLSPVMGLSLMIISFGIGMFFLLFMVKYLHRRPFLTLITPKNGSPKNISENETTVFAGIYKNDSNLSSINWKKIFTAAAIWFSFMAIFEIGSYFISPENYTFQADWSAFVPLVLVCIFLLPLQTSFEELLMRGYLMQGIGLGTGNRLIALLIPSLIFALMHSFNPEVTKYGFEIMMVNYFSIGLMLGIITLMDDSLELALGVHWANNFYGATMVTFSGSALSTPALFRMDNLDVNSMTIAAVIGCIVFVLLLSKIYGWKDWSKIYGKV